jgi:hypothetical protein
VVSGQPRARDDVAALEWVDLDAPPGRMAFAHQPRVLGWVRERVSDRTG